MDIKKEFGIKLDRIRALLRKKDLSAVFLKRQDDYAWITCGGRNYVGAGDMGNCGMLITEDGFYAITNNIEAPRMKSEEHLNELGAEVLYGLWYETDFEKKAIASLVPDGKVGYDFGKESIAEDIKLIRMDLTEYEISRYLGIGQDASEAIETACSAIAQGDTEYLTASRVLMEMEKRGLEPISCMVAADERISLYRHPLPTSKCIDKFVQIGGNFRREGLIICMTRYVSFGTPAASLAKQMKDNQLIDCTYMASSIPGKEFTYPLQKGKEAYEALGYGEEFSKHHQGGPIGYAGRDYRVDSGTPGKIQEHQAFCWNPSITGTKSEDTCIVTPEGIQMVTKPVLFPSVEIIAEGKSFIRPDILRK